MLFVIKKRSKIYVILVCKILIDGVMVVKLGKIVYLFTQHVHPYWKSLPHLFLKIYCRKFTLFWSVNYISIELWT